MARPIVLSNGEMHVGINDYGLVHDFYYPYVGLENHAIGHGTRHRVGVWVNGDFSWLDDGNWNIRFDYEHDALVGKTRATNEKLRIQLSFVDAVDGEMSTFMRSIDVTNLADETRDVRVFLHQAFVIGDSRSNTDTAQYLPDTNALVHYRGRRVLIVSAVASGSPFDQHSIGLFGIEGREGTFKDAEDGELSMTNVEHGRVDSVLRFRFEMLAQTSEHIDYHISAGTSLRSAIDADRIVKTEGVASRLRKTAKWWQQWLEPAIRVASALPEKRRQQFVRSVMILKSHIDKRGAVIASTDSAMLNYGRDAYGYTWPRDTAYILWPLIRLGYTDEPRAAFDFYRRVMHADGYFSHKYRADGAIGSSWHPYVHQGGIISAPIQTDETAVMLFMFTQFYHAHPSVELIDEYYQSFVKPTANFLSKYIEHQTSLPRPSYDLWEESFMTTTYTTAATYAALLAAAELAEIAMDNESSVAWRAVAEDMKEQSVARLYNADRQCFNRGYLHHPDGSETTVDTTVDVSSVFGAFMFGLQPIDSPEIINSFETIRQTFDQPHNIGLPRYENDAYGRSHDTAPSSYWHVTTLWYAQYCIEAGNIEMAERIVEWVEEHSYESGVLAEQIDPESGYSRSVAPLAWSHAEYVATVLDLLAQNRSDEVKNEL